MASTMTLTGDWLVSFGNKMQTSGTGNLGAYATNGVAVSANQVGLGVIESLVIDPAGGYTFSWDKDNAKVLAYRSAGFTPAGTNATSAVTGTAAGQVFTGDALAAHRHVLHFQTSAAANAVTAAANQLRTAAAAFDVAGVANSSGEGGIVDVTAGTPTGTNAASALTATAAAQVFTGTAVAAAAMVEVSNGVSLAGVTFRFRAIGY